MLLTQINIFPIKSLPGVSLKESKIEPRGLEHDRRFMLVDENGRFLTQREIPAMTQLALEISGQTLSVFLKNAPHEKIEIPLRPETFFLSKRNVTVWQSTVSAAEMPSRFGQWFSEKLGRQMSLVFFPEDSRRATNPEFADGFEVSFADGYPFLIIGEASLEHLNGRLDEPLPMNRFRPNFVFSGGQANEEDTFGTFLIGNEKFRGVKPCGRCIIITTDQETGSRSEEPLKTLSGYRKFEKSICFGENLVWLPTPGTSPGNVSVKLGDEIRLLSKKHPPITSF